MRDDVKALLIFAGGVLTGSVATYLALKKYFENKCDSDVESVKKAFTEQIEDINKEKESLSNKVAEAIKEDLKKDDKVRSEIFESGDAMGGIISNMARESAIDYKEYYTKNSPAAVEVDDFPREDSDEGGPNYISEADTVNNRKDDNDKKRRMKIISYDEYGSIPGYDFKELYYYSGDNVLTDDTEDIIDNPELLIGDALTKYGFATNDEKQIYVRNEDFSCDYEIIKVFGNFA